MRLQRLALVVAIGGLGIGVLPTVAQASTAPSNDDYAAAAPLAMDTPIVADTTSATTEAGEPLPTCSSLGRPVGHTVWYRVEVTSRAAVSISSAASKYDTVLALWQGAGLGELAEVSCSDDDVNAGTLQSSIAAVLDAGTYYLQAGGWGEAAGLLRLRAERTTYPVNDSFADAFPVTSTPFEHEVALQLATLEAGEPQPCGYYENIGSSVWYRLDPARDQVVMVRSDGHHVGAIYQGSTLDDLSEMDCFDYGPLEARVEAGQTYWIQVGVHPYESDEATTLALTIDLIDQPVNDEIEGALPILLTESLEVSTVGATGSFDVTCGVFDRDLWYQFIPDHTGSYIVDINPNSDWLWVDLGVYTDSPAGLLQQSCTATEQGVRSARFVGVAGKSYWIRAGTAYEAGSLTIWLRESKVA